MYKSHLCGLECFKQSTTILQNGLHVSTRQAKLSMAEMPFEQALIQIIVADPIGPFVQSPEGNTYTLTIIDHCTGWAEVYPILIKCLKVSWSNVLSTTEMTGMINRVWHCQPIQMPPLQ